MYVREHIGLVAGVLLVMAGAGSGGCKLYRVGDPPSGAPGWIPNVYEAGAAREVYGDATLGGGKDGPLGMSPAIVGTPPVGGSDGGPWDGPDGGAPGSGGSGGAAGVDAAADSGGCGCNLVTQDCPHPQQQACYPLNQTTNCCMDRGGVPAGAQCSETLTCEAGSGCLDDPAKPSICVKFCDPNATSPTCYGGRCQRTGAGSLVGYCAP
jgi:hypothetical protein